MGILDDALREAEQREAADAAQQRFAERYGPALEVETKVAPGHEELLADFLPRLDARSGYPAWVLDFGGRRTFHPANTKTRGARRYEPALARDGRRTRLLTLGRYDRAWRFGLDPDDGWIPVGDGQDYFNGWRVSGYEQSYLIEVLVAYLKDPGKFG